MNFAFKIIEIPNIAEKNVIPIFCIKTVTKLETPIFCTKMTHFFFFFFFFFEFPRLL